jgi:hypothetical protein
VDGLSELLNQFAQAGCHGYLQSGDQRMTGAGAAWDFIYLTSTAAWGQLATAGNLEKCFAPSVAATIISK